MRMKKNGNAEEFHWYLFIYLIFFIFIIVVKSFVDIWVDLRKGFCL